MDAAKGFDGRFLFFVIRDVIVLEIVKGVRFDDGEVVALWEIGDAAVLPLVPEEVQVDADAAQGEGLDELVIEEVSTVEGEPRHFRCRHRRAFYTKKPDQAG